MIKINMDKAKEISHANRKAARVAEFAPHDAQIAAQIPGDDREAIEAKRQEIRDRHKEIQNKIDAAKCPEDLHAALRLCK